MRSAMIDKLKVLHLPGFAENLELRLQEARGNRLDFEEFLEILIDDELAMRQAKKRKNVLKKANFRDFWKSDTSLCLGTPTAAVSAP